MSPKGAFTYRDYEALPNDGRRYEIHDGELCVTPTPSLEHQIILADRPEETSIVQPDILYIAPERMGLTSRRGMEAGPTLAIEILSPSTRRIDRVTKSRLYARYGVPVLWLVDPEARTIEAFTLRNERYVLDVTARGAQPIDLPPFTGLGLVPDALWP
jgi:Uma2 family endonuclease